MTITNVKTLSAIVAILALFSGFARSQDPKSLDGTWLGTIKAGAAELRVALHLKSKPDGSFTGTFDSIDQGAKGLALDNITFKDRVLRFELKIGKASYEGKLNANTTELDGTWKQSGQTLPLTFKKTDKVPEVTRPQNPKKPYPYLEEEVSYRNEKAGIKFAGTLTLPKGAGPFPAVLLITGSGPQDRDESLLGHKPFLVLADHLTRKGIAVLRVDDRGVGGSTGNTMQSTTEDFAGDALAGVAYLQSRKEINPKKIGLLGHSEGGVVAPLAASRSKEIAFIVLLAGTGLPGEDILYLQAAAGLRAFGASEDAIAKNRAVQEKMFAILKSEKDPKEAEKKLRDALQGTGVNADQQIAFTQTPWFRFFLGHDPRPALIKVRCPVLALNGEKDVQVTPKENLRAIEKALKEGGNSDFTIKEMPGLNHLFQTCKTGAFSEYAQIEETIAPAVLELIADWIVKRTK